MPEGSALNAAARALRHRDRSACQLEALLADRGFGEDDVQAALESLTRAGVLDDMRYAENRARVLAERSAGNAYIRHDLAGAGVDETLVEEALATLASESERADRIVARRGASVRTARYLAGKGFADDVVRAAVAEGVGDGIG